MLLSHVHPTAPSQLPFRIRHAVLSATFASPIPPEYHPKPLPKATGVGNSSGTGPEDPVRPLLEASLGPKWIAAPENQERFKVWLENSLKNRYVLEMHPHVTCV